MNDLKPTWTKEEMRVYLLIFCANADFVEHKAETDFILSTTNEKIYKTMHSEYEKDNDFQSIKKIQNTFEKYNYSINDTKAIFDEIKELFFADGDYPTLERNMLQGLKRILKD